MKATVTMLCRLATVTVGAAKPPAKQGEHAIPHTVIAFSTMYAVDEAFLGETNAIRGAVTGFSSK